jgi:DNA-binding response OmpR family regulator
VDEALDTLNVHHFDLVVCDYRMPGKTGIDLLIELKRRKASVPVLMISAYADALAEAAILQLGALELMKKPIRRQALIARAAQVVGGRTCHYLQSLPATLPDFRHIKRHMNFRRGNTADLQRKKRAG